MGNAISIWENEMSRKLIWGVSSYLPAPDDTNTMAADVLWHTEQDHQGA